MKKMGLLFAVFLLFIFGSCSAFGEIEVTKKVIGGSIQGQKINIAYDLTNTFSSPVEVFISDMNIITDENYGYNLECAHVTLPAGATGTLDFVRSGVDFDFRIKENGTFDLGAVTIQFENPDLGIVEKLKSDNLQIIVEASNIDTSDVRIDIPSYNYCDNSQQQQKQQQQSQMKNQQSKEDAQKEAEQQAKEQQANQEQMQEQYDQQSKMDKKVEQAQQNSMQDSRATKDAMQKEAARKAAAEQQMQQQLENSEDFQKQDQQMKESGYEPVNKEVNSKAGSNSTGDFEYEYKNKETGETATVSGNIDNGSVSDMQNTKDIKENSDYQSLRDELQKKGFMPEGEPQIKNKDPKKDSGEGEQKFEQKFTNPTTGETAEIEGDINKDGSKPNNVQANYDSVELLSKIAENPTNFNRELMRELATRNKSLNSLRISQKANETPRLVNGNETIISNKEGIKFDELDGALLERPKFYNPFNWWIVLFFLMGLLGFGVFAYMNRPVVNNNEPIKAIIKKVNFRKVAKKMLSKAKQKFENGDKKEAYVISAEAVRFYHSYKSGIGTELTNTQLLKLLKRQGLSADLEKKVLDLCGLVGFAKYKPNKEDFDTIIEHCNQIIK